MKFILSCFFFLTLFSQTLKAFGPIDVSTGAAVTFSRLHHPHMSPDERDKTYHRGATPQINIDLGVNLFKIPYLGEFSAGLALDGEPLGTFVAQGSHMTLGALDMGFYLSLSQRKGSWLFKESFRYLRSTWLVGTKKENSTFSLKNQSLTGGNLDIYYEVFRQLYVGFRFQMLRAYLEADFVEQGPQDLSFERQGFLSKSTSSFGLQVLYRI